MTDEVGCSWIEVWKGFQLLGHKAGPETCQLRGLDTLRCSTAQRLAQGMLRVGCEGPHLGCLEES